MDTWTERLSEYIDGEMDATSAASLEQHLRGCAECRDIVADLRLIASHASALQPVEPARDLWSGIASQINPAAATSDSPVLSLDAHRTRTRRSITLSMPQLAAAAVVLLVIGGTAVWQMNPAARTQRVASNGAPTSQPDAVTGVAPNATVPAPVTINPSASTGGATGSRDLRNVSTHDVPVQTLGYDAAIQQLESAAQQNEAQLDPATKAVIVNSMKTIDRAIADARKALAADPANAYLHRHLDRTMKQKLELLRQAAKIDRGGA